MRDRACWASLQIGDSATRSTGVRKDRSTAQAWGLDVAELGEPEAPSRHTLRARIPAPPSVRDSTATMTNFLEAGELMRTRIVSADAKMGYFLIATLLEVFVVVVSVVTLGSLAGTLIAVPLQFLVVGFAVRNFRDVEIESVDEPRPWWRMTARPTSGFVFGALFIGQGLWVAFTGFHRPDGWALVLGATTEAFIGAMFVRSSFKLRAENV